ncbi:hypothetical protein UNDKW_2424 [Undibacterium sp. KW1]|uniref:hypothetical protein n=1 Tax=Undibacterium sp. KW1 TaxID=2058624 RepID=UPI001331F3C1|nr:hypothetical protein [Undibacterium sp. KW1]BBB60697.1 hypothetical protein UNDKW_2424 [Undibacterium sp. KW1]
MNASIYDKTEKGREEITTRKHQLASRLRTLLVMIDGKQSAADIMKKVSALGLTEQNLQELLEQEFIVEIGQQAESADGTAESPPHSTAAATSPVADSSATLAMTDAERFQALYNFYNETIKSAIGLRGYGLQLKVERAANIDDFRALRQAYIEAVQKAKGPEMARSLSDRLDLLLGKP